MNKAISKTALTVFKYIAWTGAAALIAALSGNLDHIGVSTWLIPVVAAILKGIATFIATQVEANKPDK